MLKPLVAALLILAAALAAPVLTPGLARSRPSPRRSARRRETQAVAAPAGSPRPRSDASSSFSIVTMFLRADYVVKAVMILLLLASLWSWTIIFNKLVALSGLKRKAQAVREAVLVRPVAGRALPAIRRPQRPSHGGDVHRRLARMAPRLRGAGSLRESALPGVKERIEKAMSVTILRETDGIERQLGMLATIGSVSPFVGLFGTVWGIMNSFTAIAARHDTTLAVVAPGIAEALFATALGLFAAIPAVIFYNRFVAEIGRYVNQLDAFADEFSAILSRQLDEKVRADGGGHRTHGSARGRGRMRRRAMAEINVTPFVDVMLVLLIVFMVTAPLLTVGVPVDLPKTRAPALGQDREPLVHHGAARRHHLPAEGTGAAGRAGATSSPPSPAMATTSASSCAAIRPCQLRQGDGSDGPAWPPPASPVSDW